METIPWQIRLVELGKVPLGQVVEQVLPFLRYRDDPQLVQLELVFEKQVAHVE